MTTPDNAGNREGTVAIPPEPLPAHAQEAARCERDDRLSPIKVLVTETIEYEVTIDPTEPRWEWLQDSARAEWVGELNAIAEETDGPVEHVAKAAGCVGAWREVTYL